MIVPFTCAPSSRSMSQPPTSSLSRADTPAAMKSDQAVRLASRALVTAPSASSRAFWAAASSSAAESAKGPAKAGRCSLSACRLRNVIAAAVPVGKRRRSTLIIWRFMGMARVTPSTARKKIHAVKSP